MLIWSTYSSHHLNEIMHRSLTRTGIPATKEPAGLTRADVKRAFRLTLKPWREGRYLIWDATVADTTAASYVLPSTAIFVGSAVELAAARKETKYAELSRRYEFMPAAFETHGSLC